MQCDKQVYTLGISGCKVWKWKEFAALPASVLSSQGISYNYCTAFCVSKLTWISVAHFQVTTNKHNTK